MSFLADLPCVTASSKTVIEQKKITRSGSPIKVVKLKKVTYVAQHETNPPQHQEFVCALLLILTLVITTDKTNLLLRFLYKQEKARRNKRSLTNEEIEESTPKIKRFKSEHNRNSLGSPSLNRNQPLANNNTSMDEEVRTPTRPRTKKQQQ